MLEDIQQANQINDGDTPNQIAYLLHDVDRGDDTTRVAVESELQGHRVHITIAEAIAILTHYPDILSVDYSFKMTGSRLSEKCVPSFSLNDSRPRLGWCRKNVAQNGQILFSCADTRANLHPSL